MTRQLSDVYALIIEDDSYSTDVLGNLLDRLEVSYIAINNGLHILDVFTRIPRVDVIFLDLELPGATGYEVFKIIKSVQESQSVPVVAYTSHTNEMAKTHKLGFNGFLSKPLNGSEFADQLARILDGQEVWE